MAKQDLPVGQLFTHVYLQGVPLLQDSENFRRRLGVYLDQNHSQQKSQLVSYLRQETGLQVSRRGLAYHLEDFLVEVELKYLLDLITLTWRCFQQENMKSYVQRGSAFRWHQFVSRCFREEKLGYQLDVECGVHYFVDEEFERNRVATLSLLGTERYSGVRHSFEAAYTYLDSSPPDTKASVRSLFESVEILTKLMVNTSNLNQYAVKNMLKEKALTLYTMDEVAAKVVSGMFDSLATWVHSIHDYRHGQGQEEPVAPPIQLAVYIISSGAAFLRWLVEIDVSTQAQQDVE